MIAIADAGVGNLCSVQKAFRFLGYPAELTTDPRAVARADALVVPGQGAFGDCMAGLTRLGLRAAVLDAIGAGTPYLGICLGLQVLFEGSDEHGGCEGLGVLLGTVTALRPDLLLASRRRKVPHMGWNRLDDVRPGLGLERTHYYFAHSFHVVPRDSSCVAAWVDYGERLVAAVSRPGLLACQFHPEKSQRAGLAILDRFAREALAR